MTNKKRKADRRMKLSELKKICSRPDLVQIWDVTSPNPKLLLFLKSYRNSVPVPRHWSHKRNYLQGKRGIEKQPFRLPDFVAATGIAKIREDYAQKQRTDHIDYRVLHDAFFKYQTKPNLTARGDVYYEGKEFEVELKREIKQREMKPGMVNLSGIMKQAVGMTRGGHFPPPWLISMQRHGPPPSYPDLKRNEEEERTRGEESEACIQSVGVVTPNVIDIRKRLSGLREDFRF